MNLRTSTLGLVLGLLSTALWAQDQAQLDIKLEVLQWEAGQKFEYEGTVSYENERMEGPKTFNQSWTLRVEQALKKGGYRMMLEPTSELSLATLDPQLASMLEGRINTPPPLPMIPPIYYRTNSAGQIQALFNMEQFLQILGPYYVGLRQQVIQKVSSATLRNKLTNAINQRLSPSALQILFDQWLGPIHAWYGSTVAEGSTTDEQGVSSILDGIGLPYSYVLEAKPGRQERTWTLTRTDRLNMLMGMEILRNHYLGEPDTRADKETLNHLLESSTTRHTRHLEWTYDTKKRLITEYQYKATQYAMLITEEEPVSNQVEITLTLKKG